MVKVADEIKRLLAKYPMKIVYPESGGKVWIGILSNGELSIQEEHNFVKKHQKAFIKALKTSEEKEEV